jgi:3-hydroxy-9,10-secoandrosta-1,3,5(10)-triene-9,17-dione monooxygenase
VGKHPSVLSAAEALQAVRDLVPRLKARAAECEALRRAPDATIADLHAANLMRLMQPRAFGGSGLGIDAIFDLSIEMCRGCPSTTWVWMNLVTHSWNIGQFPIEAQHDVWDADPNALATTGLAFPAGRASKVSGGYRVTGKWPFGSGVDAATWMLVGAMVERDNAPPGRRFFLIPQQDFRSLDNWRAYGLTGSGSHDVEVIDALVPEHRSVDAELFATGLQTPGGISHGCLPYLMPPFPTFGFALGVVPLGSAKAAIEEFVSITRIRAGTYTGTRLAELTPLQIRIGEAHACVDLFEKTMRADMAELIDGVARGESPSVEARLRWKRNIAFGVGLATRAVDTLMAASGAGGLSSDSPLARHFRDVHASASHIALTWDVQGAAYGQHALGLPLAAGLLL